MEVAITRNTAELERLEGIIRRNLQSFYEVGSALREIRDKGLYRDVLGFDTFEAYCKAKWDMKRTYAFYMIESAKVIDNVHNCEQKPATESQVRPLSRLDPEKQREAWTKAVSTAPEGKVTAAHVYKIVKGMMDQTDKQLERELQKRAEKKELRFEMRQLRKAWKMACDEIKIAFAAWIEGEKKDLPTDAMTYAQVAIGQLERILKDDPKRPEALAKIQAWISENMEDR